MNPHTKIFGVWVNGRRNNPSRGIQYPAGRCGDLFPIYVAAVADGAEKRGIRINKTKKHAVLPRDAKREWKRMIVQFFNMQARVAPVFFEAGLLDTE